MRKEELIGNAMAAMKNAYAPYSKYTVGAALLGVSGEVYFGCNVENSSYGATNCAERTAIYNAISRGEQEFCAIAIVGGKGGRVERYCPPCGICRQVLSEFCGENFRIYLYDGKEIKTYTLGEMLPQSFSMR
ncbi:MAG: cytidine deaminase [Clostridia bacterium]|nr:cytidine deaminase [Clostridia bacterium]